MQVHSCKTTRFSFRINFEGERSESMSRLQRILSKIADCTSPRSHSHWQPRHPSSSTSLKVHSDHGALATRTLFHDHAHGTMPPFHTHSPKAAQTSSIRCTRKMHTEMGDSQFGKYFRQIIKGRALARSDDAYIQVARLQHQKFVWIQPRKFLQFLAPPFPTKHRRSPPRSLFRIVQHTVSPSADCER